MMKPDNEGNQIYSNESIRKTIHAHDKEEINEDYHIHKKKEIEKTTKLYHAHEHIMYEALMPENYSKDYESPVIIYKEKEYPMKSHIFTVGHSKSDDIVVNSKFVKFRIFEYGNGYSLSPGIKETYLNGKRVYSDECLRDQDCIQVVEEKFYFLLLPKIEEIEEWRKRPLDKVYPILSIDKIYYSVRKNGIIRKFAAYVILGINSEGKEDVLTIEVGENENYKYWLSVLNSLKNRGVKDTLIICAEDHTDICAAIHTVFPKAEFQRKIDYPKWRLLEYSTNQDKFSSDIRDVINMTNAIVKLDFEGRLHLNDRFFPSSQAILKALYVVTVKETKNWTMPIRNWSQIYDELITKNEARKINSEQHAWQIVRRLINYFRGKAD